MKTLLMCAALVSCAQCDVVSQCEAESCSALERKSVDNRNGLNVSYLEGGNRNGQLLVFIHGFPEHSGTWRAQLTHFAARGFWVVAYDQRGYGSTTGWDQDDVESFSAMNLARDAVGLIQAIGGTNAVLIGHDWGSFVAFFTAILRPDVITGLMCMSAPAIIPTTMETNPAQRAMEAMAQLNAAGLMHYQQFLATPEAETAILADPRTWVKNCYRTSMGESPFKVDLAAGKMYPLAFPIGTELFGQLEESHPQASFVPEEDLDSIAESFANNGVRGALNYYKMFVKNVEFLQIFAGSHLKMPYAFLIGEHDVLLQAYYREFTLLDQMPTFTRKDIIPGAGHWVQQEKPEETNALIDTFLSAL